MPDGVLLVLFVLLCGAWVDGAGADEACGSDSFFSEVRWRPAPHAPLEPGDRIMHGLLIGDPPGVPVTTPPDIDGLLHLAVCLPCDVDLVAVAKRYRGIVLIAETRSEPNPTYCDLHTEDR